MTNSVDIEKIYKTLINCNFFLYFYSKIIFNFRSEPNQAQLLSDITTAVLLHEKKISETKDPDKLKMMLEELDRVRKFFFSQ